MRDGFPFLPDFLVEPIRSCWVVKAVVGFGEGQAIHLILLGLRANSCGLYIVVMWVDAVDIVENQPERVLLFGLDRVSV